MKKHTEKRPIDDLFAKRLSNMSLPPSSDGFERLQARMGQRKPEAKVILWRNPVVQKYTAAACVVLVCGLGWQYWPSGSKVSSGQQSVAYSKKMEPKVQRSTEGENISGQTLSNTEATPSVQNEATPGAEDIKADQEKLAQSHIAQHQRTKQPNTLEQSKKGAIMTSVNEPAQKRILEEVKTQVEVVAANTAPESVTPAAEQIANNTQKPAERILVVTIPEPEALVAARQAAKASITDQKPVLVVADKLEKETKAATLWQQVKRIKQGDVLARRDNNDEERSLLGRAYNGIKHNLDKDKSAKQ
ncbi:hypothetical protein ACFSUS_16640 [Spirosoma soli]|uniref:Uncharacterized protein n=1 Tax=Spirosoma soli TaxID=1770529 RepID=A0ABW5M855_9BACT